MQVLKPEVEEGNVEYKRFLINIDDVRLEQLATQMRWRLEEGDNEAIYYLGVNDNGSIYQLSPMEKTETFKNFNLLVEKNKAEIISCENIKISKSNESYYRITIRRVAPILPEIRVLLLGDSETGKTTFLANLILNKPHTDKSDSRIYMMNHKHELESKKTSSTNCNYIVYNKIKYVFIEAPGYHEYSRTKFKLLLGTCPDVILLFDDSDGKPNKFDKFICDNLSIPYISINVFNPKSNYNSKKPLDKSKLFESIGQIYKPNTYNNSQVKINILNVYPHNDLGTVVSGFLASGKVKVGQQLSWSYRDETTNCKVNSIHINSEPTNEISAGQMLTLCLKPTNPIKKNWKHGTLLNINCAQIKKQIVFNYQKFNNSVNLPSSIYGFCSNRIVHVYNINYNNGQYTGTIVNYIPGDNIIVVDFGLAKGLIKITN